MSIKQILSNFYRIEKSFNKVYIGVSVSKLKCFMSLAVEHRSNKRAESITGTFFRIRDLQEHT